MASIRIGLTLVFTGLALGCSLDRAGIGATDQGPVAVDASSEGGTAPSDAGTELDAGAPDADAGPLDGGELDAGPWDAGPPDAGPPDAGPPDAGPPDACAGRVEACDGRDEDCDGRVDEDAGDCGCDRVLRADGRSYLFCTEHRDYDGARAFCTERGYDLVVIDDADENAFVRAEQGSRGNDFLLGLDDRAEERTFVWVDGRVAWRDGTTVTYANWRGSQPDDFFGEDCVEMQASGQWNDVDCGDARRHVCESPAP